MSFLDTAKDAYELAKKGMTIEFQEKVMELREQAIALQEENIQLRKRILDIESKLSTKESLTFKDSMYFRAENGKEDGPFCPKCYDDKEKLVRLHAIPNPKSQDTHHCRVCDDYFGRRNR
jgi:hypothetical protein